MILETMSPIQAGGIVVIALSLVETVKFLVNRLVPDRSHLTQNEREVLFKIAQWTQDLHVWHHPDPYGRQDWKGMGELIEEMKEMNKNMTTLIQLMKDRG